MKTNWVQAALIFTAIAGISGCNYHIDKQMAVALPNDRPPIFSELRDAVLGSKCLRCHSGDKPSGGVLIADAKQLIDDGLVIPGKPDSSPIYVAVLDDSMPLGAGKLTTREKEAVRDWIAAGAPTKPGEIPVEPPPDIVPPAVLFARVQKEVLKPACVRCHSGEKPKGDVLLETYEQLFAGDDPLVVAGDAEKSYLFQIVRDEIMPPKTKLTAEQMDLLKRWIQNGAKKI